MANISSDAKKVLAGLSPEAQNYILGQSYGDKLTSGEAKQFLSAWTAQENARQAELQKRQQAFAEKEASLPDAIKNDPSYQTLPLDMKEIVLYNYQIQKTNDEDKAKKLSAALEQATAQADPYWKNIMRVAQDEVLRGFEAAKGDYVSQAERQQRRIQEIEQDLTYNKDYLSLEAQSELATLARNYDIQKEQTINAAADAGLTFSTKRKLAEERLAQANTGMVESTTRQYNKRMRDLQEEASRGSIEAQAEIKDLQRRIKETTTDMGRKAESYLGTENLPQLEGYEALGAVPGQLYEEKVKDVEQRKNAIYGDLTQQSLNYSLNNLL